MAGENNVLNPGSAVEQTPRVNRCASVILSIGAPTKDDGGFEIDPISITSISINENMFAKLPTATIVLHDDGTYMHDVGFDIGKRMYITITPGNEQSDIIYKPYIQTNFIVEDIQYTYDSAAGLYAITLMCIYDAEAYLCDVYKWPIENKADILNEERQFNSRDVLSEICSAGGLKFACELEDDPDDEMTWLNIDKTCSEFAQYIVAHAWLGDPDLPILYVDKDGTAIYTSLNTMAEAPIRANYVSTEYFQKFVENKQSADAEAENTPYMRLYDSATITNIGHTQLNGAYGMKHYIYNPYNKDELNILEFAPVGELSDAITNNEYYSRYKVFWDSEEGEDPEDEGTLMHPERIGNISTKSTHAIGTTRWITSSTRFKQTHEFFDYAVWHNKVLRDAWAQSIAELTVNTNEQMSLDADGQHVHLGDKIKVDFATVKKQSSVQSNTYLVGGITHFWSNGGSYVLKLTCVSDGIGGIGNV